MPPAAAGSAGAAASDEQPPTGPQVEAGAPVAPVMLDPPPGQPGLANPPADSLLLVPLSVDRIKALMQPVAHDLAFLWTQTHIPLAVQARLSELGYTDLGVSGHLDDNPAEVRNFAKNELGMDPAAAEFRTTVARVVKAWEGAHTHGVKRQQDEAEQRSADLPRRLPAMDHQVMLLAYNEAHDELEDDSIPAP